MQQLSTTLKGNEQQEDRKLEINGSRFTVGEILSPRDLPCAVLVLGKIIIAANHCDLKPDIACEFARKMGLVEDEDEDVQKYRFLRAGIVQVGRMTIGYGGMAVNEFDVPTISYFNIIGANGSTITMRPDIGNRALIVIELDGESMNNDTACKVLIPQLNKIAVALADAEIERIENEKNHRQIAEQAQIARMQRTIQEALEGFVG